MADRANGAVSKPGIQKDLENGTDNISMNWFKSSDKIIEPTESEEDVKVKHPTTGWETLIHLLKGNLGSGLFAMGDAIKNSGIVLGPIMVIFLGIACTHCMHLLLQASERIGLKTGVDSPNFPKTVELCFANGPPLAQRIAPFMKKVINIFLCVTQLGFCCVYFVFISSNTKQLADYHGVVIDVHLHMLIILVPITLSCLVRSLKFLAPISLIANLFLATGFVICLYFVTLDLPDISERKYVAEAQQLPLFFGTALFAFEGIGLVLPLKNEMEKPAIFQKPFGVLNIGMCLVTILYATLGSLSYLKFGEDIEGSVTLNIPDSILGQSVKIIIPLAILMTYALQFYIAVDIIWPAICARVGPMKHPKAMELVFRVALVLVTFTLAEVIPYLNFFISLVGAISSTALALLFPPILEIITTEMRAGMIIKNILLLLLGVLGCVTGTYESISNIARVFNERELNQNVSV